MRQRNQLSQQGQLRTFIPFGPSSEQEVIGPALDFSGQEPVVSIFVVGAELTNTTPNWRAQCEYFIEQSSAADGTFENLDYQHLQADSRVGVRKLNVVVDPEYPFLRIRRRFHDEGTSGLVGAFCLSVSPNASSGIIETETEAMAVIFEPRTLKMQEASRGSVDLHGISGEFVVVGAISEVLGEGSQFILRLMESAAGDVDQFQTFANVPNVVASMVTGQQVVGHEELHTDSRQRHLAVDTEFGGTDERRVSVCVIAVGRVPVAPSGPRIAWTR